LWHMQLGSIEVVIGAPRMVPPDIR
jgi:hypothetical protein